MSDRKCIRQCVTCPWLASNSIFDIPGYDPDLHVRIMRTIATPGTVSIGRPVNKMLCHYSPEGENLLCAGWLANQLGAGHNIALRLQKAAGKLPKFELIGEQRSMLQEPDELDALDGLPVWLLNLIKEIKADQEENK
jgi:hypothetical protein